MTDVYKCNYFEIKLKLTLKNKMINMRLTKILNKKYQNRKNK